LFKDGDVERILLRLRIEGVQRGDNITALCPMHKFVTGTEDRNPSWGIHVGSGLHNCFSCGYKGNLLTLISDYLDLGNLDEAKAWLNENVEVDWNFVSEQLEEARKTYYAVPRIVPMSEGRLGLFKEVPEWAAEARKLTVESCNHYGVLWREGDSTWILPIRGEDGNLMGWQEKGQITRKFFNRPPGVPKSRTFFGLHKWEEGTMIIVESPLDAVRLHSLGIQGGVAACGAIISHDQIKIMRRADKLILALDNDAAGKESTRVLFKELRKEGIEFFVFNYGDFEVKDIGDMTKDQIDWSLENSKHCVMGEAALI